MNASNSKHIQNLLHEPSLLIKHITRRLYVYNSRHPVFSTDGIDWLSASAVLFLLGRLPQSGRQMGEPCLILNKRSVNVRQPGDLCCPGGRVNRRLDAALAALLKLPILNLTRWPYWPMWRQTQPREAKWLSLLLTTGVRESIEEMRLNPFRLDFLGPLPAQALVMFKRVIYPMVLWVPRQTRFYPNWEVEKVIRIPVRDFFEPTLYARYQLRIETPSGTVNESTSPCFRYVNNGETEILWGATFRITMDFLNGVFGFWPPDIQSLPEIRGQLSREYMNHP